MGLDMYLSTSFYVGGWDNCGEEGKKNYNTILKLLGLPLEPCPASPSLSGFFFRRSCFRRRVARRSTGNYRSNCKPA